MAASISFSQGIRYSFPRSPSTTLVVMLVASFPVEPACCKSSRVMTVPQQGQVAPDPDIVPPPIFLSCSLRCVAVPLIMGTFCCTPNTTPVLSAFGSIVSTTRLFSLLQSQRVLSNGMVARQFLQVTLRAQR